MCPGSQSDKLTELVSNFETSQPKVKIHARHMYWRCSPPDGLDRANINFIRFLECFDEDVLEMIHNDMNSFTCDEMKQLGALEQWKNSKEISLGNGKVMFVEPFLHFRNCTVYFERLDGEAIWKMIQSFLSRDLPVGCSFDFYNEQPPKLEDVLKAHSVTPKHQPIFPDDIGVEGRHTQRFKMRTEGNFLVVKNTEMGIRGTVQKIEE
ncbi:unnamed protein product [Caenorhabditis brenneri]